MNNWSVRETESRIRNITRQQQASSAPPAQLADPNVRAAEAKLRRRLGTQVRIVSAKTGVAGRIEIEFYSAEDLNRLYDLLVASDQSLATTASASSAL